MLSMWILKSPSIIMFGDSVNRWVSKTAKSFRKSLWGLGGGGGIVAMMVEVGPGSASARCSNEDDGSKDSGRTFHFWW